MARKVTSRPTDAELAILGVLWKRGPSTVRDVHEQLHGAKAAGYTTVLKTLQIMLGKGLVLREESQKTHVYRAAYSEEETQRKLLRDLLDRAFEGSAQKLILQALAASKASAEELKEIRKLLDEYQGGRS